MHRFTKYFLVLVASTVLLFPTDAFAQLTNQGILDQVATEFSNKASSWQTAILSAALRLFYALGTISLAWTGGMLILRKADFSEFFVEFTRFIIFFGFFLWLLNNGPAFALSIVQSLQQLGAQASGTTAITPSGIVDIGFTLLHQTLQNSSVTSPIDSLIGVLLTVGVLLFLAAIAANMLMLMVTAWVLMYAGIFFLGFGGSRWTSDIAINYYKTVLGIASQLFAMILLVGVGNDLLTVFYGKMNTGQLNAEELSVMLVFCFVLMLLTNRIPALLGGIVSGSGTHHALGHGFGIGSVIGAAAVGTAAASTVYQMSKTAAGNVFGGASAVMAAMSQASENVGAQKDFLSNFSSGDGNKESGESPLGEAMGGDRNSAGFSGKAGRFAADTVANLAKGTYTVGKEAVLNKINAAKENIRGTVGGQIAEAIRPSSETSSQSDPKNTDQPASTPSFGGDSLSGSNLSKESQEEVATFRDKQTS